MNKFVFSEAKDRIIELLCSITYEKGYECNTIEDLVETNQIKTHDINLIKELSFYENINCNNCMFFNNLSFFCNYNNFEVSLSSQFYCSKFEK